MPSRACEPSRQAQRKTEPGEPGEPGRAEPSRSVPCINRAQGHRGFVLELISHGGSHGI